MWKMRQKAKRMPTAEPLSETGGREGGLVAPGAMEGGRGMSTVWVCSLEVLVKLSRWRHPVGSCTYSLRGQGGQSSVASNTTERLKRTRN